MRWRSPEPGLNGVQAFTTWLQAAYIGRLQRHIVGTVAEIAAQVDSPGTLQHFYAIRGPWPLGMAVTIVRVRTDRLAVEYHFAMLSRDPNPAERAYAEELMRMIADAAWEAGWREARTTVRNTPQRALTGTGEPDLLAGLDTPEAMAQLAAELNGPFGTAAATRD